jgi:hypothetical protein
MYQAHLNIPLEIWVEGVPFGGRMRYNVGARSIAPLVGWTEKRLRPICGGLCRSKFWVIDISYKSQ